MADLEGPLSATSATACVHRWLIATPVDDLCNGTCRLCGAKRSFTNERYAFGQPGRARRVTAPARQVALPRAAENGALAQFLSHNETLPAEAARPS